MDRRVSRSLPALHARPDHFVCRRGVKAPDYAADLRQTNLVRREIVKTFSTVDLLITPTMPHPAETLAESKNFDRVGVQNTSPFDVFGLPTISVPCGFTNSGLPIGLQISGAPFAESTVLSLAHAYMSAKQSGTRGIQPYSGRAGRAAVLARRSLR